ncbi:DUF4870 domain-containing protein [Geomesophilobacter sediminis]|uniref:DUF4870 domain-containing protein n=1 Tax=Geomesophilobacter sediminis TaxID=2798584 RepID=A0A8J7LUU2_9BACT|nr:DUF4870 domain-containing protein [Geomesophilobacter sediminis]MBJ6724135.1 DUF4870 domain-containing protein [Geomesophilobacter sediminis]
MVVNSGELPPSADRAWKGAPTAKDVLAAVMWGMHLLRDWAVLIASRKSGGGKRRALPPSADRAWKGAPTVKISWQLTPFGSGLSVVGVVTGFAAIFMGPLLGILGLFTLVMAMIAAVRSRRGDYFQIPLSAEFLK